jgi:hypothetical protein
MTPSTCLSPLFLQTANLAEFYFLFVGDLISLMSCDVGGLNANVFLSFIFFLLFKIIKLLVSSFGRSAEIGAFAAQFRDAGLRVRSAGGGQRQQDGGPGG